MASQYSGNMPMELIGGLGDAESMGSSTGSIEEVLDDGLHDVDG